MDHERIRFAQSSQRQIDDLFLTCCHRGDLDALKYMLTSPDLKLRPDFTTVDKFDGYDGLTYACVKGHLDVIDYLLFSPELEKNDYFSPNNFTYLRLLCKEGHFHIADFLRDKKVFEPINVFTSHQFDGVNLNELCEYLVIRCDIPITPNVQNMINTMPFVAEMFAKRELNKELNNSLAKKEIPQKKFKL